MGKRSHLSPQKKSTFAPVAQSYSYSLISPRGPLVPGPACRSPLPSSRGRRACCVRRATLREHQVCSSCGRTPARQITQTLGTSQASCQQSPSPPGSCRQDTKVSRINTLRIGFLKLPVPWANRLTLETVPKAAHLCRPQTGASHITSNTHAVAAVSTHTSTAVPLLARM